MTQNRTSNQNRASFRYSALLLPYAVLSSVQPYQI